MKKTVARSIIPLLIIAVASAALFVCAPVEEADAWLGHICEIEYTYTDNNGNVETSLKTVIYWHGHLSRCDFICPTL